ncbi:MAG: DUF4358 domain-containing protein [Oscillospiraceae bacterium]|nr:DUF4358 domain-containing protein [Oscillospiraceae bacterium]
MKKMLLLLLTAMMLVTACGVRENQSQTTTQSTTTAQSTTTTVSQATETIAEPDLQELYDIIINSVEFPYMMEQSEELLPDNILNNDNVEEYIVEVSAITVFFNEVILIKAVNGKTNEVYKVVQERQESLLSKIDLYPGQQQSIASSVAGKQGSIVYFICHENALAAEAELLKHI